MASHRGQAILVHWVCYPGPAVGAAASRDRTGPHYHDYQRLRGPSPRARLPPGPHWTRRPSDPAASPAREVPFVPGIATRVAMSWRAFRDPDRTSTWVVAS